MLDRRAGEVSLRALGEHGDLRDDVRAGLEVGQLLAVAPAPLVAGPDAAHASVGDEQLLGGRLGEDHRAARFGLLGQPAAELRERRDEVRVVAHRRRCRDPHRAPAREEVDRLVLDAAVEGHLRGAHTPLEQRAQRARIDDGAGEQLRAWLLALLDDRDRHLAEPLGDRG